MVEKYVIDDYARKINNHIRVQSKSIFKFSCESGVSEMTIRKILKGDPLVKQNILDKLDDFFNKHSIVAIVKDMNDVELKAVYTAAQTELMQRNIKYANGKG